jgi:hypothetical protein
MAQRHLFFALSNPSDGRSDEFHTWYDAHHLQDVVDYCPGFERGQRYWVASEQVAEPPSRWSSLALYELETEDVAQLHLDVFKNAGSFTPSNGVFDDDHVAWVYSPIDDGDDVLPSDEGSRSLLLAFSQERPSLPIASGGASDEWRIMKRHPDQREGNTPPWRHLTIASLATGRAVAQARDFASATRPAALWLFERRGLGVVSRRTFAA